MDAKKETVVNKDTYKQIQRKWLGTAKYSPPPPPDNLDELRDRLADAEARIERLETALAAVMKALTYGDTTYPSEQYLHQHALCGLITRCYLSDAAKALGIEVDLGLDEEE